MKNRICQTVLALTAGLSVNIIGWPGPHGGLQFLSEGLWSASPDQTFGIIKAILLGFAILGVVIASVPQRQIRLAGTWASVIGLMTLFLLLLKRIYPPVIPIVLITAIPFLGSLAGSMVFAYRPKCSTEETANRVAGD
jgi:hypothetical protein